MCRINNWRVVQDFLLQRPKVVHLRPGLGFRGLGFREHFREKCPNLIGHPFTKKACLDLDLSKQGCAGAARILARLHLMEEILHHLKL